MIKEKAFASPKSHSHNFELIPEAKGPRLYYFRRLSSQEQLWYRPGYGVSNELQTKIADDCSCLPVWLNQPAGAEQNH
jgi:hypothetical protein